MGVGYIQVMWPYQNDKLGKDERGEMLKDKDLTCKTCVM